MGFIYFTTIFIFIEDRLGFKSCAGILNALVFTCFALMSFVSFVSCVLMDPGHVPSNFVPEIEVGEVSDQGTKKNGVNSRLCDKCSTYKPPRAHHCRVCRRCVLRMDHHCMWINNCVGFGNYKPFFILILYAATASIYSMVMIITSALQKDWELKSGVSHVKILYVTCGSIMAALSLTLGTLLFWHTYLLSQNMTTIEYHEGIRATWLARKSGQNYRHPFHLGVYRNIISILGPNMLKWFCPTAVGHLKDGISFPTSRSS
ncbi:zinc finger protein [Macleaya cordata]|uniref:S-acyltransferase n=1 Tax=Macleaya cordata TaxID=56857 RepID=A0A200Q971_MACCD|nr:zinc finger protein [Macleaya cordata]